MEKKTLTIIIVAVVAIAIIAGVVIAFGMSTTDDGDKYVTYEGCGGVTSPEGKSSYKCYSDTVDEIKFFNDNNQLTSFNDKADGSGKIYHTGDHVDYGTTLYAQWTKITKTNVKISTNSGSLSYITIKNGSDPLSIGDNELTNDNCKFTITFEPTTGYTLTTEGSTSFDQFFIIDNAENTVCTIKLEPTYYSEASDHNLASKYDPNKVTFISGYAKEISVTLTYAK